MPRFLRHLRIAFSATCGVLCLLLIVLWVRSYWSVTIIQVPDLFGRNYQLILSTGTIHFNFAEPVPKYGRMIPGFTTYHRPSTDFDVYSSQLRPGQFDLRASEWRYLSVIIPYWFAALTFAAIAVTPWIRWKWRFSLRTLLIATTLVAVVLGIIVWLARR